MSDILDDVRKLGLEILSTIDPKAKESARSYYSVSKILLDVDDVETKKGKAGEKEVADALSRHTVKFSKLPRAWSTMPEIEQLRKLIQVAEQRQKDMLKWQTVTPENLKDIAELIGKMLVIVLAVLAVYDRARKAKKSSKRHTKRNTKQN